MKTLKHLISQVSLLNKSNLLQQARIKLTCLSGSPKNLHTMLDRKSTRLNSSHSQISYAVFCLKKKTYKQGISRRNIRSRITIPLTLSNLKLRRRITTTENILQRHFARRQVVIHNRLASTIGTR